MEPTSSKPVQKNMEMRSLRGQEEVSWIMWKVSSVARSKHLAYIISHSPKGSRRSVE
jgi:hypothetical protein